MSLLCFLFEVHHPLCEKWWPFDRFSFHINRCVELIALSSQSRAVNKSRRIIRNEAVFGCIVYSQRSGACQWSGAFARSTTTGTGIVIQSAFQEIGVKSQTIDCNYKMLTIFSTIQIRRKQENPSKWFEDVNHKNKLLKMICKNSNNNASQQQKPANVYTPALWNQLDW